MIVLLILGCKNPNVIFHECGQTASSLDVINWNIKNKKDRLAMRETIDGQGRVIKLEFLINQRGTSLCYLPSIVEYEYKQDKIIETLYDSPNNLMTNICEMNYQTIYNLENGIITSTESFFKPENKKSTTNLAKETSKDKTYLKKEANDSINMQIEFYIYSFAKMNGSFPINAGYKIARDNSVYLNNPEYQSMIKAIKTNLEKR